MPYTPYVDPTNNVTTIVAQHVKQPNDYLGWLLGGEFLAGEYGATGNGTTDDSTALANMDSANAGNGVSHLPPASSRYRLSVSKTLAHATRFDPGAIVKPDSGVTLTLNGPIDAGAWQIFDLSAGGSVALPRGCVVKPEWFGADPTGTNDSATALQQAFNAAQAVPNGGAVELGAGAVYKHSVALTLGSAAVEIFGHGHGSQLLATANMTGQIVATDTAFSILRDFKLDGGSFACDGLHFVTSNAPSDKATSNEWLNLETEHHGSANWPLYNQGHEDLTIGDGCITRETGNGLYASIPGGALRISDSSFFGNMQLSAQQLSVKGCVTSGVRLDSIGVDSTILFAGCYMYDTATYCCVDTTTNLPNVTLDACYMVLQNQTKWINGNIPQYVVIRPSNCVFIDANVNAATTLHWAGGSGSGWVLLDGCQGTIKAGDSVAIATGVNARSKTLIQGIAVPNRALTAPGVPASGSALLQTFGVDAMVYLSGGTVTNVKLDDGAGDVTNIVPGANQAFLWPSGYNVTLTYTGSPAWQMMAA